MPPLNASKMMRSYCFIEFLRNDFMSLWMSIRRVHVHDISGDINHCFIDLHSVDLEVGYTSANVVDGSRAKAKDEDVFDVWFE